MATLAIFGVGGIQLRLVQDGYTWYLQDNDYTEVTVAGSAAEQLFHGYTNLHAARREGRFENHGVENGHFASLYRKAVYLFNGLADEFICDECIYNHTCTRLDRPVQFPVTDTDGAPNDYCDEFVDVDSDYVYVYDKDEACTCEVCTSQG